MRESRAILLLVLVGCQGVSLSGGDGHAPGTSDGQRSDSDPLQDATRDAAGPLVIDAPASRDERPPDRAPPSELPTPPIEHCGDAGEPCCDGSCRQPGYRCLGDQSGRCLLCGGPGQDCCPGNGCDDGGCCADRLNADRRHRCVAAQQGCAGTGVCAGGSCGGCGGLDQPCCRGDCTAPGAVCVFTGSTGRCVACGGADQPCCAGQPGQPPMCATPGFVCSGVTGGDLASSRCVRCGPQGSVCCVGSPRCPENTACREGSCIACGDVGQPCCGGACRPGGVCNAGGVCEPCGGNGQPCCGDQRCTAPGTVCYVPKESVPPNPPFCRSCGLPGQPCCVKRTCVDGAVCTGPERGTCLRL